MIFKWGKESLMKILISNKKQRNQRWKLAKICRELNNNTNIKYLIDEEEFTSLEKAIIIFDLHKWITRKFNNIVY
jgi:hypothetical protein